MGKKTQENNAPQIIEGSGASTELLDTADTSSVVDAEPQGNGDAPPLSTPTNEGETSLESARAHASNTDHRSLSTADKPGIDGSASAYDQISDLALEDIGKESISALSDFDPAIHAVTSDGQPKLNKDGSLAKKRGRKGGAVNEAQIQAPQNATAQSPPTIQAQAPVNHKVIAQQYAHIFFIAGYSLFGSDWLPDDTQEKQVVEKSIQTYVEANNVEAMSPGIGLLLTLGAYSVKKAQKPTIKEKLSSMFASVKPAIAWIRSKMNRG